MTELPEGRELDALVAEKVMGWSRAGTWLSAFPRYVKTRCPEYSELCPNFSTDIAAAWEVVEKLGEDFDLVFSVSGGGWRARHSHAEGDWYGLAYADTAPLAICRAALLAVGAAKP